MMPHARRQFIVYTQIVIWCFSQHTFLKLNIQIQFIWTDTIQRNWNLNNDEKLKCEKTSICKLRKKGSWHYTGQWSCTKQLTFIPRNLTHLFESTLQVFPTNPQVKIIFKFLCSYFFIFNATCFSQSQSSSGIL